MKKFQKSVIRTDGSQDTILNVHLSLLLWKYNFRFFGSLNTSWKNFVC